jgi:hypothetical protein
MKSITEKIMMTFTQLQEMATKGLVAINTLLKALMNSIYKKAPTLFQPTGESTEKKTTESTKSTTPTNTNTSQQS